jgi:hypothetical protein
MSADSLTDWPTDRLTRPTIDRQPNQTPLRVHKSPQIPHQPKQSRQRKKAKCQQLTQNLEAIRAENAALAAENEGMRKVRDRAWLIDWLIDWSIDWLIDWLLLLLSVCVFTPKTRKQQTVEKKYLPACSI